MSSDRVVSSTNLCTSQFASFSLRPFYFALLNWRTIFN